MEEGLEGFDVKLLTEGFTTHEQIISMCEKMWEAHTKGYETEFVSGKHDYPTNEHLRDCYEMGVKQCRDEVRMERMRHG